ncbi:hypothetical protein DIZ81_05910 [Legionella taurinensis]|uniref:Uncharacterized protein n=1 Tax=Legionella taurinensis TaxID=70611 RepID=A0A3A5L8W2_9GAMM|nr:hypothetical protein [Legionella taurinensis]MDX1837451.1 hypothetical protein [Legionella taurinensis]PUT40796.1 hypothetical protein DB744_05910 [Legionella taurinensis]PUT44218.1 hypothetical protein DB746_04310 [Legionella taurinensis]PUT47519.1 hypothetical protein DB743_02480 [Legionella taurinensis]PUT48658.1 hypothetical protein DB745_04310 [Legionella taurinensis]
MVLSLLQIKEQIQTAQQAFRKAASDWLMQQPIPLEEKTKWRDCFKCRTRESLLNATRHNGLPLVANDSEAHQVYGEEETIEARPPVVRRQYGVNGDAFYEQYCRLINLYELLLRAEEILTTVPQLIDLEDLSYFALLAGNMDLELNKAPENVDIIADYHQRLSKARADFAVADHEAAIALYLYEKHHQDCQRDFIDILILLQNELQTLYHRYPNTSVFKYVMYDHWQTVVIATGKALFGRSSCRHPSIDSLKILDDGLNELIESAQEGRADDCHQLQSEVAHYKEKIKGALSSAELKLGGMTSRMRLQDQLAHWRTPTDPALGISFYANPMFGFWRAMRGNGWIDRRMLTSEAPRVDASSNQEDSENTQIVPS